MANSDKNIVITPNIGSSSDDPKVVFTGANTAGLYPITLRAYPTSSGTLSFEGSAGQLFSITNSLTGTLFSVNDVSGMPSIEVLDTGLVKLAQYSGNVLLGTGTDNGSNKLQVNGTASIGGGNRSPAGTTFSNTIAAATGNYRTINFDGNGNTPSIWWTNGSTPIFALDAQNGGGATFWSNNGSSWQQQMVVNYGNVTINTDIRSPIFYDSNNTGYYVDPASTTNLYRFQTAEYVVVGGNFSNNAYNSTTGTRLMFGGGDGDAQGNYYIGTNLENYGGNYNKLDLRWHTGIRMGAQAGYGGIRFYDSEDLGTQIFAIGKDGSYAQANQSMRAPIFYDLDNTSYYLDPASTSVLNTVQFASGVYLQSASTAGDRNLKVRGTTSSDIGITGYDSSDNWRFQLYASTSNYGFLNGLWGGWDLQKTVSGNLYMNNNTSYYLNAPSDNFLYRVYGAADIRAPIFYDTDNTGFYVDPASISNFSNMYINGGVAGISNSSSYTEAAIEIRERNFGGAQDDTWATAPRIGFHWSGRVASQIAMSSAGRITILNNPGNSVEALACGAFYPTIIYDLDNTGYYVDPASTSNLNVLAVQRAYAGYDAGVTSSFSCSNWFRSSGATGWYNASYEGGIYMEDSTWVRVYNSKAFYVANQIAATGNITAYYSDERLKTKIGRIENALNKVCQLEGFLYVNNEIAKENGYTSDKVQVALSAQQVQQVQPEVVSLAPFDMHTDEFSGEITSKSGENYLTVDYARLVPLLVEAIKEQQKQIEELRSIIATK